MMDPTWWRSQQDKALTVPGTLAWAMAWGWPRAAPGAACFEGTLIQSILPAFTHQKQTAPSLEPMNKLVYSVVRGY